MGSGKRVNQVVYATSGRIGCTEKIVACSALDIDNSDLGHR